MTTLEIEEEMKRFEEVLKKDKDISFIICVDDGHTTHEGLGGSYLALLGMCEEMKLFVLDKRRIKT